MGRGPPDLGLSRLAFYTAAFYGSWALPAAATEIARVDVRGPAALGLHWRFDAIHYYSIAVSGYNWRDLGDAQAFLTAQSLWQRRRLFP
ncbi:MAG TPA: hypothetical protein VEZ12_09805, partial [Herpetosiphonaceae bacterium]|nr:hypothetical protein [Herpetosiphonaceae bacterium]